MEGKSLTLNTVAPKLIQQTMNQVDQIAQQRIQKILNQGGKKVERIAPKIIKGTTEEVYKTPFRLLGQFGKKKFAQVKRKITNILKSDIK